VKIGRTLLTAGVFALLAMIYVPTPHRGYRLIFSSDDTSIALFQLLVNVVFAALLGAILATIIPKIVRGARENAPVGLASDTWADFVKKKLCATKLSLT